MVFRTIIVALVLSGCATPRVEAPICRIKYIEASDKHPCPTFDLRCHDGNKSFDADASDLDGWFATDAATLRKFGTRLESCANAGS